MKISLPKKITSLAVFLLLLLVGVGFYSFFQMQTQRTMMTTVNDVWLPAVSKSAEININITKLRGQELEYLNSDEDARVVILEDLDTINQNLFIYLKVFEPLIQTDQQKKLFSEFQENWGQYQSIHDEFLQAVEEKKIQKATELLARSYDLYSKISTGLTELTDISFMEAVKMSEASNQNFKRSQWTLGITICITILLATIMAIFIIRDMKKSLSALSASLDDTSNILRDKSSILSSSSQELSAASTESAASLQETVASLEELTATVKSNSTKAAQASELSDESQAAVQKGRQKLSEMIQSMNEVSRSSEKIYDIIAVIDDIAFQTNLLALNAAVEAARAGEQGKGFAVVAEAVRGLAQKSADSAHQIKELISDSKTKTEKGVQNANESDESLKDIVHSVERLATLIKEVAQDSEHQNAGINQVAQAMNQIDRATQELNVATQGISSTAQDVDRQAEVLTNLILDLQNLSGIKSAQQKQDAKVDQTLTQLEAST